MSVNKQKKPIETLICGIAFLVVGLVVYFKLIAHFGAKIARDIANHLHEGD